MFKLYFMACWLRCTFLSVDVVVDGHCTSWVCVVYMSDAEDYSEDTCRRLGVCLCVGLFVQVKILEGVACITVQIHVCVTYLHNHSNM